MIDYFHLNMDAEQLLNLSSLGLAHLGDGVFELMVRSWLCLHGKATSKGLHRATVRYVAAPAQARAVERILPLLTGEEGDVFRRGRNTSPHSVPQNASRADYRAATPRSIRYPATPAALSTAPPRRWRPCSAGCGFRAAQSGSTNCLL